MMWSSDSRSDNTSVGVTKRLSAIATYDWLLLLSVGAELVVACAAKIPQTGTIPPCEINFEETISSDPDGKPDGGGCPFSAEIDRLLWKRRNTVKPPKQIRSRLDLRLKIWLMNVRKADAANKIRLSLLMFGSVGLFFLLEESFDFT